MVDARVLQRLVDGEVRVLELHVLADEGDLHVAVALGYAAGEVSPLAQLDGLVGQAELRAGERVQALVAKRLRDEVDVAHVLVGDDSLGVDVGEEGDLVADVARERLVRAADDDVGMDTDAAQLVDRVLRRLRLQLAGRLDERDEGDMQVENVLRADLAPELANRLEERERLDVADGAADLGDDDVGVGCGRHAAHAVLDLVRDVRDHLHRRAEVLALPLAADDRVPDRARRVVRVPGEVLVDEALVVADVEIGLGPVLCDEDLAVLEGAHRPRVDVDVRVELLNLHAQAARLQQAAQRGGGDALTEGRDDAARHEHVLRRAGAHQCPFR